MYCVNFGIKTTRDHQRFESDTHCPTLEDTSEYFILYTVSDQKVSVYSRKPPKTGLFTLPGALFKSGAALKRIQ